MCQIIFITANVLSLECVCAKKKREPSSERESARVSEIELIFTESQGLSLIQI